MTREEFEKTKWTINRTDLMPENLNADPECKSCNGHGVVEETYLVGGILVSCPDCWIVKPEES